ncbi:hypothetical protein BD310DRAFT_946269 [Dichomitus squalens]|uniref:REJ domain-containing protein n=1 Tax=Dichomitus squalens TaxID=114155 RepID=A0A4Q9Q4I2_9APHY|nr:hypothetical protein BD310DRAFT_946269 [Dichomitus squalens]
MSSSPAAGDPSASAASSPPPAASSSTSPSSSTSSSHPSTSSSAFSSSSADPPPSTSSDSSVVTSPPASSPTDTTTTTPPPSDTSTSTSTSTSTPTSTTPTDTGSSSATTPPPSSISTTSNTSGTATDTSASTGSATASLPSSSSSSPSSPSSSSQTTSTATQTSTIIGTLPDGQVYTSVVTTTLLTTPTISASTGNSHSSSSHTGAIVGGVVGGIAGLAILATLAYFLLRRRRDKDDFDGNFDPDRVVGLSGNNHGTLPDIDLGADNITPYNYTPGQPQNGVSASLPAGGPGAADMRQYGPSFLAGAGGVAAGAALSNAGRSSTPSHYSTSQPAQSQYGAGPQSTSDHGYPEYAAYAAYANPYAHGTSPTTSPTSTSFGPQVAAVPGRDFRHPSPGPSLGPTDVSASGSSSGPGVIPSAKEREALARRGNLSLANPDGTSGVVQHQDGGRLDATPEDEEEPSEVPPRYDTIPHDR